MNNTKSRSEALAALCAQIAQAEGVDATKPPALTRPYAEKLAELDGNQVSIEAYRQAWTRYLRRSRHPSNPRGGARNSPRWDAKTKE